MNATVSEFFGLLFAIIALAAIGLLITRGDKTVRVVNAFGGQFRGLIKTATFQ